MSEETQQAIVFAVVGIVAIFFLARSCESDNAVKNARTAADSQVLSACLSSQRPMVECEAMVKMCK